MTGSEIFVLYVSPFILVAGGALMAWRNHLVMRQAHALDRTNNDIPDDTSYRKALETIRKYEAAKRRDGHLAAE